MSEFELWQFYDSQQQTVTDQFQFWMATTFAVVIASYTAGDRLALWARLLLAGIYLAAASLFLIRYNGAAGLLGQITQSLLESSDYRDVSGAIPGALRRAVMIVGSLFATFLICFPKVANQRTNQNS